jgi:predicted DCC family thiol-disulfide oxidoreductase YuxK
MSAPWVAAGTATGIPTLLYDDECGVCRGIAGWVRTAARRDGVSRIDVRPIGEDPQALLALNPGLDIWDAYDTIHLLMPDGSMRLGGQAVAELLRRLPAARWFAWSFALSVFGWHPFQNVLDLGYLILADVRPVFGCESCGTPSAWIRPLVWCTRTMKSWFGEHRPPPGGPTRFTPR